MTERYLLVAEDDDLATAALYRIPDDMTLDDALNGEVAELLAEAAACMDHKPYLWTFEIAHPNALVEMFGVEPHINPWPEVHDILEDQWGADLAQEGMGEKMLMQLTDMGMLVATGTFREGQPVYVAYPWAPAHLAEEAAARRVKAEQAGLIYKDPDGRYRLMTDNLRPPV